MSMIFAMSLFSLSMSISPGPVNLITLSSGINHGARKTLPFVGGAALSFALMLLMVGVGIGELLAQNNLLMLLAGTLGSAFIAYLGIRLATAPATIERRDQPLPSFTQGLLLQWLNPKAWIGCISGVSAFSLAGDYPMLLLFTGLYGVICYLAVCCWAFAGARISRWLDAPNRLQLFNRAMGLTLLLVAVFLLAQLGDSIAPQA